MGDSRDVNIKEVLLNFDIEILSNITHDIICTICHKIMIDPSSLACGCNFCKICAEGAKVCAAHNSPLINQTIELNHIIKRKIEMLLVKCPNVLCQTEAQLCQILEHIQSCPFQNYKSKSDVKETHFNSLRNEIETMKKMHEEQLKLHQRIIDRLENQVKDVKRDSDIEQQRYERRLDEQKMEMEKLEKDSTKAKIEMDLMKVEMSEMKKIIKQLKNDNDERFENINLEMGDVRMERLEKDKWCKIMRKKVIGLEVSSGILGEKVGRLDYGEYIWTIHGFRSKRKDAQTGSRKVIKSDPFYSHRNGYKMCVRMYPNGFGPGLGTHLYLGFVIMKGEYDDVLRWPFKHRVTLSVVNQRTGEDHTRMEYEYNTTKEELRYILDKAATGEEKNVGLGYSRFILLDSLLANEDTFAGDKVCVRCSVSLQPH